MTQPLQDNAADPSNEARFYSLAKDGKLALQRCKTCKAFRWPVSPLCPECNALGGEWTEVSGRGKIFSYVIYYRAYQESYETKVPYVVAVVELDEGPRLLSNIVGVPPDRVSCDMAVEVVFNDIRTDRIVPQFQPLGA